MRSSNSRNQLLNGLWLCLALGLALPASGADHVCRASSSCGTCLHSIPDLWVVNSRCAPRCTGLDAGFEKLTYERWDAECCVFVRETRESFLAAQANIPTLLFSHGNTLTHEQAMDSCWKIRERLRACPGRKMMVYWSWPAQILYTKPLIRPLELLKRNLQAKYVYSEYQGYYIAKLANMMSTAQPLSLGGHSYGGVCAICALHYLGGGELNGLVLEGGAPVERPNLRAVIVSGALDNDSMYPGYRYGQTFAPVETFYTTYNVRDATLKRWPKYSFRGQEAAGYTGLCASRLGPFADKLFQQKLTEDVGKSHYIRPHLASDRMIAAVCNTAFPSHEFMPCGCHYCTDLAAKLRPADEPVATLANASEPSPSDSHGDSQTNVAQLEATAL